LSSGGTKEAWNCNSARQGLGKFSKCQGWVNSLVEERLWLEFLPGKIYQVGPQKKDEEKELSRKTKKETRPGGNNVGRGKWALKMNDTKKGQE